MGNSKKSGGCGCKKKNKLTPNNEEIKKAITRNLEKYYRNK